MSYELEKELGIQKALTADLELKNRSLREIAASSTKVRGDLEEQLSIQKSVYEAKLERQEKDFTHKLGEAEAKQAEATQTYKVNLQKLIEDLAHRDETVLILEKRVKYLDSMQEIYDEKHNTSLKELRNRLAKQENVISDIEDVNQREVSNLKEKYIREQKEHKQLASELGDHVATQDTMIKDLTDENQRLALDLGKGVAQRDDLQGKLDKQDSVIQDLTNDLLRVNRDNGLLQVKLENLKADRRALDRQGKALSKLVDENQTLKTQLSKRTEEHKVLQSQLEEAKHKGRVLTKLEGMLDGFE